MLRAWRMFQAQVSNVNKQISKDNQKNVQLIFRVTGVMSMDIVCLTRYSRRREIKMGLE
jgi:hypothetical protein